MDRIHLKRKKENKVMKIYTDLEQSKKLAKILPLESADMRYGYTAPYDYSDRMYDGGYDEIPYPKDFLIKNPNYSADEYDAELPCWSLAALMDVLPDEVGDNHYLTLDKEGKEYCCCYEDNNGNSFRHCFSDNPIDACVDMIENLHKQKLL